ncbi:hypothetical protein RclHR1_08310007 [Rhizophagus clarus]|uniref:Kinase-like domain-containing protein n=1 Tax=Rhizophagus clarus TaxID=94130 RepID=A0A2Z6SN99_9GLOM|nr:hypothetical protein RclHR1_08310007 [Rhizophagus clarus]GES91096.1 kinase-like domain-containing protein [Rhizophagus clarus]
MQAVKNPNKLIEEVISKKYIKYYEYKNFHNIERIKKSNFEEIYHTNMKNSEQYFTLKSYDFNDITVKEIVHEFKFHHDIVHKNVIQFFGISHKENENGQLKLYLLMEYAGDNTLQNYLKENCKNLTWENKYNLAYQLVYTISCLHDKEIVHCYLHSSNILVYKDTIKLIDFGLSERIKEASNQNFDLSDVIPYLDPKKFVNTSKPYLLNKKSDVYSIGVLLWEISSGLPPFKNEMYDDGLATRILEGYREKIVSDTPIDYSNLYIECWKNEQNDRPNMNQVVIKLKEIITKSNIVMDYYQEDINYSQLSNKYQINNLEEINITNTDNNLFHEKQIIKNFNKINIKEIEPITYIIIRNIFKEDLSIIIDELVDIYFKEVNEGKEEKVRKQVVLNYINNHELNLQEFYFFLLNNQNDSNFIYLLGYFNLHGIGSKVNIQKALELFQKAVKLDNNAAHFDLATIYMDGFNIGNNYYEAFALSNKLAKKGYSSGINLLGYCYDLGIGTKINEQKAFESYQKAANLGNSGGLNNLGTCYENGTGTELNEQKAFELYQKAADLESSYAINNLASCYKNGVGTDVNEQKAFELYQKAADLENVSGIKNLAYCYKYGIGTSINDPKAIELYQKATDLENS